MQGRWFRGLLYALLFLVCLATVLIVGVSFYISVWRMAMVIGEGAEDIPAPALGVWDVVTHILVPLAVAILVHAISLVDAWAVCQQEARAWTERRAEERLRQTLPPGAFLLLGLLLAGGAGAADIHQLVASNEIAAVSDLLATTPAAVNAKTADGVTPLHLAAAKNQRVMATVILSCGADVNARTAGGFTPLHWAASRNALDAAQLLVQSGADVNAAAGNGLTPLHWAAGKDATNMVNLLILAGADINRTTSGEEDGYTPLEYAVSKDATQAAILLAFHAATRRMVREKTEGRKPAPAQPPTPGPSTVEEPAGRPATPQAVHTPEFGKSLTVPIGYGQELEFVWVDSLKLWVGKYEVSNGQYRRLNPRHNSYFRERYSLDGEKQPAVYVSWEDAAAYAQWLNKSFGDRIPLACEFRLPTDEEWMACARCGDKRVYPWGDDWPPKYGNFSDVTAKKNLSSWKGVDRYDDKQVVACAVTESGHNEWGIYGLAGNVWEWCADWYEDDKKYKIRHGGSWDFDTQPLLRLDYRGFDRPDTRSDTVGFRMVIGQKTK